MIPCLSLLIHSPIQYCIIDCWWYVLSLPGSGHYALIADQRSIAAKSSYLYGLFQAPLVPSLLVHSGSNSVFRVHGELYVPTSFSCLLEVDLTPDTLRFRFQFSSQNCRLLPLGQPSPV